jgi:hypothetical protein
MYTWPKILGDTVLLQAERRGTSSIVGSCRSGSVPGLAAPARIAVVSLDGSGDQAARDLIRQLERRLGMPHNACEPPKCRLLDCAAMQLPRFMNTLVLIATAPIGHDIERLAGDWLRRAPDLGRVLPVLLNIDYSTAIPDAARYPVLSLCAFTKWTTPHQIASLVLEQALTRERPQAFISYVRSEASAIADQLHDELSRRGYRIFLDRFAGTPGRLFPEQLAEEMAEMGVVIALETPGLLKKRWTRWEIAFARQYGIGIVALSFQGAPKIPGVVYRHPVLAAASAPLAAAPLEEALDKILSCWPRAALRRRAMYHTIVAQAAAAGGGSVQPGGLYGVQLVRNGGGTPKAVVLAAGRPGRLHDVHLVELQRTAGLEAILSGQHAHLPAEARKDMAWLAKERSISLAGRSEIFRRARQLAAKR